MYIIESGELEVSVHVSSLQQEERVSLLSSGDFVGELSVLDGLPRTATVKAVSNVKLLEMKRNDFISFLLERPTVSVQIISELGKRIRHSNDLVINIASKNPNKEVEMQLTFWDKLADKIAKFGGSWKFLFIYGGIITSWFIINSLSFLFAPIDPYPYLFLSFVLNVLAAVQAPIIMMSQNRAQNMDRVRSDLDYYVNLKSELLLQQLNAKIDELRTTEIQVIRTLLEGKDKSDAVSNFKQHGDSRF